MLMFPDNSYGHMHVNAHGTLRIQGVQREDAGFLVCSALSVAGSSSVRAFLQVLQRLINQNRIYSSVCRSRQWLIYRPQLYKLDRLTKLSRYTAWSLYIARHQVLKAINRK